jgi:hypothetical protein
MFRALPLAPLVIGTMAPDFEYLLRLAPRGRFGHTPLGLVVFCLPTALLAWAAWSAIVRPALAGLLPPWMAAPLTSNRPRRFASLLALGCVAALVGAISHVVWDGFTHAGGWAVAYVPVLREQVPGWPGPLRGYRVLQHASSVLGLAVIAAWLSRWISRLPEVDRAFAPAQRRRCGRAALGLIAISIAGAILNAWRVRQGSLAAVLSYAAVGAMVGTAIAVLGYGIVDRARGWAGCPASVTPGHQRHVHEREEAVQRQQRAQHGQQQAEAEDRA